MDLFLRSDLEGLGAEVRGPGAQVAIFTQPSIISSWNPVFFWPSPLNVCFFTQPIATLPQLSVRITNTASIKIKVTRTIQPNSCSSSPISAHTTKRNSHNFWEFTQISRRSCLYCPRVQLSRPRGKIVQNQLWWFPFPTIEKSSKSLWCVFVKAIL